MQTSFISTAALRNQPRYEIQRLQSELADRAHELATQRHADIGLTLGNDTARMVSLRNEVDLIDTLQRSNGTAAARLALTQAGLSDLRESAGDILQTLIALPPGSQSARLLELESSAALERVADRLNASDGGSFLFGGINSGEAPFSRFEDGPRAAVEAAFLARFGVAVGDPGAAAITEADMADFLANDFAALFDDPSWGAVFSVASSTDMVSRIGTDERAVTGTNANEAAIRNLVEGLSMVAGLGIGSLSERTRDVVVETARQMTGQAVSDLAALQGELAFSQNAIERADQRLMLARDLIAQTVADAEIVDPAQTKVRIDLLTTQLEMSFAMTGQLSRLSILNYA